MKTDYEWFEELAAIQEELYYLLAASPENPQDFLERLAMFDEAMEMRLESRKRREARVDRECTIAAGKS